jgi:hypothetical protein
MSFKMAFKGNTLVYHTCSDKIVIELRNSNRLKRYEIMKLKLEETEGQTSSQFRNMRKIDEDNKENVGTSGQVLALKLKPKIE